MVLFWSQAVCGTYATSGGQVALPDLWIVSPSSERRTEDLPLPVGPVMTLRAFSLNEIERSWRRNSEVGERRKVAFTKVGGQSGGGSFRLSSQKICPRAGQIRAPVLRFYLIWENKRRDRLAAAAGGEVGTHEGDEFLDMTDKQQKAVFRYLM